MRFVCKQASSVICRNAEIEVSPDFQYTTRKVFCENDRIQLSLMYQLVHCQMNCSLFTVPLPQSRASSYATYISVPGLCFCWQIFFSELVWQHSHDVSLLLDR